jgi:hypothetical protein
LRPFGLVHYSLGEQQMHSKYGCPDLHSILEDTTGKLGPVVGYDSIWDPKPTDNRLDELDY